MRANLTPGAEEKLRTIRERCILMVEDVLLNGFNTDDLKALSILIQELKSFLGFPSYAKMAKRVGVSDRVLLDRARRYHYLPSLFNFHRTLQGLIRLCDEGLGEDAENRSDILDGQRNRWIPVPVTLHGQIALVSELLNRILTQVRHSNEPETVESLLTPIDKARLVACLETAIFVLKAPLVEVGLFNRLSHRLLRLAKSAGSHGVSAAVGAMAGQAGTALAKLIGELLK